MPHDRAAIPAQQPALIKTPDQLQQAKRADEPRGSERPTDRETGHDKPTGGILHELKTERAHD